MQFGDEREKKNAVGFRTLVANTVQFIGISKCHHSYSITSIYRPTVDNRNTMLQSDKPFVRICSFFFFINANSFFAIGQWVDISFEVKQTDSVSLRSHRREIRTKTLHFACIDKNGAHITQAWVSNKRNMKMAWVYLVYLLFGWNLIGLSCCRCEQSTIRKCMTRWRFAALFAFFCNSVYLNSSLYLSLSLSRALFYFSPAHCCPKRNSLVTG